MIGRWRRGPSGATLPGRPASLRARAWFRAAILAPLALLAPALLSGCNVTGLSIVDQPTATPAPTATVAPTPVPQILSTGFDQWAGNCPDAADEDIALIGYAQSQNYNFDMQLRIAPTAGCDAALNTPAYHSFVTQVGQATLTLNALDTAWVYGYAPTREAFVQSVYAKLQAHYPSLTKVSITVAYGGRTRATLTYSGQGQPVYQDFAY
jgi:hypothetical protein